MVGAGDRVGRKPDHDQNLANIPLPIGVTYEKSAHGNGCNRSGNFFPGREDTAQEKVEDRLQRAGEQICWKELKSCEQFRSAV